MAIDISDPRLMAEAGGILVILVLILVLLAKKKAVRSSRPQSAQLDTGKKDDKDLSISVCEDIEVQSFLSGSHLVDLWEVYDKSTTPGNKAVLSVIKAPLDSILVRKISRAVKLLSGFSHPNLVAFLAEGKRPCTEKWQQYARYGDEVYFVVTEYVGGATLQDLFAQMPEGKLPVSQTINIGIDMLYALEFLAYLKLVHRNLKPANVLVNNRGIAKITGFYLLKGIQDTASETESLTREGSSLGTPEYMPLEQCKDAAHVDCRSDIYSTGLILYQMLTGVSPFRGKNLNETFRNIKNAKPAPVSNFRSDLPEGLNAAVMKALERIPEDRYQHPTLLRRELQSML